ncbi:MAG: outer membrane beta-barrel protein [Cyanobacteria bacterium J06638_28]
MASIRRISLLAGSAAAAALIVTLPAKAEEQLIEPAVMADTAEVVVSESATETVEVADSEMADYLDSESEAGVLTEVVVTEEVEASVEVAEVDVAQVAAEPVDVATVDSTAALENTASTSADAFFEATEATEVAQVTRPLYRGAAPFYVGVGGNIGIIDSDESSVGDFGFNIISKVSFGPRFSIRPTLGISEDDVNLTIPLTYNFNPIEVGQFNMYPFAGAGADISDEVGLLINGGVDIPISRDFTLNGQLNWRTTNDTGLGLSLGVGYNFPFFFE